MKLCVVLIVVLFGVGKWIHLKFKVGSWFENFPVFNDFKMVFLRFYFQLTVSVSARQWAFEDLDSEQERASIEKYVKLVREPVNRPVMDLVIRPIIQPIIRPMIIEPIVRPAVMKTPISRKTRSQTDDNEINENLIEFVFEKEQVDTNSDQDSVQNVNQLSQPPPENFKQFGKAEEILVVKEIEEIRGVEQIDENSSGSSSENPSENVEEIDEPTVFMPFVKKYHLFYDAVSSSTKK